MSDAALAHAGAGADAQAHVRLKHHFDTLGQQKAAASLGMWVFIAQEIMFFGGMFTADSDLPHVVSTRATPRPAGSSTSCSAASTRPS